MKVFIALSAVVIALLVLVPETHAYKGEEEIEDAIKILQDLTERGLGGHIGAADNDDDVNDEDMEERDHCEDSCAPDDDCDCDKEECKHPDCPDERDLDIDDDGELELVNPNKKWFRRRSYRRYRYRTRRFWRFRRYRRGFGKK